MMLEKSNAYISRAAHTIPGASQTLSKGPTQWTQLPVIVRGDGCHVWDLDGNGYIDLPGALGPVILGYNYPAVAEAIKRQLDTGIIVSSTPNPLEGEVAEMLCDLIPCAERVRFGKNGSDVTSAAVRLARAVTGREAIISIGYHGWADVFIGATATGDWWYGPAHYGGWSKGILDGVREWSRQMAFNDLPALEKAFAQTPDYAAVILEPITAEEPAPGYLQAVRDLCTKHGTVLIFDEVKTGFRVALGGAQELYGVTPDLACFGKAMANGMPISALVGKRDLMKHFDKVFFSTTFGGECLSLAAAKATITELRKLEPLTTMQAIELITTVGQYVREYGLMDQIRPSGHPMKAAVTCTDLAVKTLIQQEMIAEGVLWNGEHMPSRSWTHDDLMAVIGAYCRVLAFVAKVIEQGNVEKFIKGRHLTEVFRR